MGGCQSQEQLSPEELKEREDQKNLNSSVDNELNKDKLIAKKKHKLLLLGTGNSGKSTFFKQLCQIHGDGISEEDKLHGARYIHDSIIHQMKNIIEACIEEHHFEVQQKTSDSIEYMNKLSRDKAITPEIADHIKILWADESIKKAFENRTNLGIVDSSPYFFENIDRIGKEEYVPTEKDILLARIPTTGIRESSFTIKDKKENLNVFEIFDVGGQRSERSKWIHCFDSVDAVMFVASLSCYDQKLFEEEDINAMHEALELFGEVVNSRYFRRTSMILFLNKSDLFKIKILTKSLSVCFDNFNGKDGDFDEGVNFIKERFKEMSQNEDEDKAIYCHITCATDRNNVQKVFDDVQHGVVMKALQNNGLI